MKAKIINKISICRETLLINWESVRSLCRAVTLRFHDCAGCRAPYSHRYTRKEERENEEEGECSKRAVIFRRARKISGGACHAFFSRNPRFAAKKRAHKYRAEATSDRLVKATRAVHASHPRAPVRTDSALISPGRAIHGERSITRRFISVVLFLPLLPTLPPPPPLPPFAVFRLAASIIAESMIVGSRRGSAHDDIVTDWDCSCLYGWAKSSHSLVRYVNEGED